MACAVWGRRWKKSAILVHCDNQAVVEVVNAGSSRDSEIMHLLRSLFFVSAHFELSIRAVHVAGKDNVKADAISRDNVSLFLAQAPEADRSPTPLPPSLIDLLVSQRPDWRSPHWSQLFSTFLRQV